MATEQTITISGTPTVVSGVTVPYANTSDLEVYIGKGKIESIEIADSGAGYTNRARNAAEKLIFSGGGGTAPNLWVTIGQDTNNSGRIDGSIYGTDGTEDTPAAALDNTNLNVGSDYVTSPNVSLTNLDGGEGGQLTASIYAKKTPVTHYTLSGTSGNTTITFEAGLLADGDKVLIKRATGVSTAANTFAAGSAITAEALNKSFDQIRYKVEELPNVTSTALTDGDKGDIKVSGSTWTIDDDAVTSAKIADDAVTSAQLANNIDIGGTLDVTGAAIFDSDVNIKGDNKTFTIEKADGTDKFTVASQTGNTTVAGTLGVTGVTTLTGALDANGGASIDNIQIGVTGDNEIDTSSGNLTIDSAGGTTNIDDTFQVATDKLVVNSSNGNTDVLGDLKVNTDKVTMAAATGNTAIAGSLTANGPLILGKAATQLPNADTFAVTHTWHELESYTGTTDTIIGATGGTTGQILVLTAKATHTITLTDGTDANDFRLNASIGLVGDNGDAIILMYDGTTWIQLAHWSDN